MDPANVEIIVVGDRTVVEQQIREQNLGDVRVLEVADVLGPGAVAAINGRETKRTAGVAASTLRRSPRLRFLTAFQKRRRQ